jgi:F-type H+-transporting ATPase subunit b
MAETSANTESHGGQSSFPPFQAEHFPSQLLWLALAFLLLYVLMAKIALPRVGAIFAERSKRIGDDIAAAERLKERSDAAHAAYEKSLADARGSARGIANATRESEAAAADETNKRLEAQLHERLAAADRSIADRRATAMASVGTIAAETAAAIVERLIGKAPPAADVAAAVRDLTKR